MNYSISRFFYRHPSTIPLLLLLLPLLWLGVIYLGSLFNLLLNSLYSIDEFSGVIRREFTLKTLKELFHPANFDVIRRTVVMAFVVTVICTILAYPISFYMALHAQGRVKALFYFAVMVPLWSSYLVRVYSWKLILAKEGILNWVVDKLGMTPLLDGILSIPVIGGSSLSVSSIGTAIVFVYIWLPYMILPIQAVLEKIPRNLILASADLGASARITFFKVILPMSISGIAAGSIFTFSLTLGDYIIPGIIGSSTMFVGQVVLFQQGTAGNLPLAAAFSVMPIIVMGIYLWGVKRLGAFDAM